MSPSVELRNGLNGGHAGAMHQLAASEGEADGPATMPIAIIGLSCKFPGDATSPDKLWEMIAAGRSAWSEIPPERFNKDAFYHPLGEHAGTSNVRGGHFLKEDVAAFDASFFSFTADVARTMDPQFRLQLESTVEALESAGVPLEKIARANTSVFAGAFFRDYYDSFLRDTDALPRYFMTGTGSAMASNRISHFFDLCGPSLTVDTGCSTALAALHLACQSIRAGESEMSIVGGSNVILNPDMFISLSNLGLLGSTGKCFSFDSRAEGYGRGEGVATVLLKPLESALRDGDPIRAVIRETALNQDAKTPTITSPSREAQEDLIRMCYSNAGLDPVHTSYVEAHGTGTKTGDPIEASAIGVVFGEKRDPARPLLIGSVKSNVGHLESASGLAAIIKVALAFERGLIPPSINFENPNPAIDLETLKLKVPTKLEQWPTGQMRRASVSNFGYGGTNTHVIMEDPSYLIRKFQGKPIARAVSNGVANGVANGVPKGAGSRVNGHSNHVNGHEQVNGSKAEKPSFSVFALSAKDEISCRSRIQELKSYLESGGLHNSGGTLQDLAYTLGQRRSRLPWATAVSANSPEDLIEKLSSPTLKLSDSSDAPRLGFVFNGQGAQWYAMGRELIGHYPVFAASVRKADELLRGLGSTWSLTEELMRDEKTTRLNEPELSLPLCAALQLCLVQLLRSWGVTPRAVTGHSSGEIAAAYAAGALNLKEALAIAYFRGVLTREYITESEVRGRMMAVGLGPHEVEPFLAKVPPTSGRAVIACVNSPSSVTLSGDSAAIADLKVQFDEEKIFARELKVEAAFHSHHMEPFADKYWEALHSVMDEHRTFDNVLFSSPVTGKAVTSAATLGPQHWVKNMVQPVLFSQSLSQMVLPSNMDSKKAYVDMIVEIGPHSALAGPIRQILAQPTTKSLDISYGTCLVRGQDAVETIQQLGGQLWSRGYPVDLNSINFPTGNPDLRVIYNLPSYPWNHTVRHWTEPLVNKQFRNRLHAPHDLLGVAAKESNSLEPTWRHVIRPSEIPWVRDHVIQSNIVFPAAGCICMAIEAMRQLHHDSREPIVQYILRDIDILAALIIPDTVDGADVQVALRSCSNKSLDGSVWREFHIYTANGDNGWTEHCRGLISVKHKSVAEEAPTWSPFPERVPGSMRLTSGSLHLPNRITSAELFKELQSLGIQHGPSFQNLKSIRAGRGQSLATFEIADTKSIMPAQYQMDHVIHPITLDALFQTAYSALSQEEKKETGASIPRSIELLQLSAGIENDPGHQFHNLTTLLSHGSQGFHVDIATLDTELDGNSFDAQPVLQVSGMRYQSIGRAAESEESAEEAESKFLFNQVWEMDISLTSMERLKSVLAFAPSLSDAAAIGELNRAAFYFIENALRSLTDLEIQDLDSQYRSLYDWMKLQEKKATLGQLGPRSSKWTKASPGVKRLLCDNVSTKSVNGRLLSRIGQNLASILKKEVSPVDLIMQDKLLYSFYDSGIGFGRSLQQVEKLVELYSHKNSRAKVLEVGAGTGTCTTTILKALGGGESQSSARFAQYDFTDGSPDFLEEAKSRFSSWGDLIRYKKLDVSRNPIDQGFEAGEYDLILASRCLHAASSINLAMENLRRLLKPGGKLIIVETMRDSLDSQLVFGTLPGSRQSGEFNHQSGPTIRLESWEKALTTAGFTGLDLVVKDCEDEEHHTFAVIMSTAADEGTSETSYPEIAIVYNEPKPPAPWLENLARSVADITSRPPLVESLHRVNAEDKFCIFIGEGDQPLLDSVDQKSFQALQNLLLSAGGILWVSRGGTMECTVPSAALHVGLFRSLRLEDSSKPLTSIDLDPTAEPWTARNTQAIRDVFGVVASNRRDGVFADYEFAERNGAILTPRIQQVAAADIIGSADGAQGDKTADSTPQMEPFIQPGRELRLTVGTEGLLDSLRFTATPKSQDALPDDFVEIEPKAFGLNFRDVMVAMGQMQEKLMGFECGGIVTKVGPVARAQHNFKVGDRVCAFTSLGGWASCIRVPATSVGHIPDNMTYEVAASIPTVWVTVHHALVEVARLRKGETVLIHAATGGVGQAAIILAQHIGAEIFTTVSTIEKRDFVVETYGINPDHIFSSRDVSFASNVKACTAGKGVDVVLNSLAGPMLQESWKCIATLGRFVEIGKRDIQDNKNLPMDCFGRAVSFSAIDLMHLANFKGDVLSHSLVTVLDMFAKGVIRPVTPITSYPISELQSAFRKMQAGKHLGKIIITPGEGDLVPVVSKNSFVEFSPEYTYLLVGGVDGLGQLIAQWAVDKGARNLILMSRSIASRASAVEFGKVLNSQGCRFKLCSCDVGDYSMLAAALSECEKDLPPIKGVIQGAAALQDSVFESMTYKQWQTALGPKVQGTLNLQRLLSKQQLDFFVLLSSSIGIVGNPSQANYGAAGAFQDAFAKWHQAHGFPVVSIDLGVVKSIGIASRTSGATERLLRMGHRALDTDDVLRVIEYAVTACSALSKAGGASQGTSAPQSQIITGLGTFDGIEDIHWRSDARFLCLKRNHVGLGGSRKKAKTANDEFKDELAACSSLGDAANLVASSMIKKLSEMFMIPETSINSSMPLSKYGVDSLVAVELRNWLVTHIKTDVSLFDVLQSTSLIELSGLVASKSKLVSEAGIALS